jgi:hypothetical protein
VPDDDDRPRDAWGAADPGWPNRAHDTDWTNAAAPDDIRELSADIAAYYRELRAKRRRASVNRVFARRGVVPACVIVVGLALAAVAAALITVMAPDSASRPPTALPLASPTAAPGAVNGLLPDVTLQDTNGNSIAARTLRPGVIALIPVQCRCAPLLNSLARDAYSETLPLIVVAPTVTDADAAALSGRLTSGRPQVYFDPVGALAGDFAARGVTLVLLNRDGTVFHVQRAVSSEGSSHLNALLQSMMVPDLRTGG